MFLITSLAFVTLLMLLHRPRRPSPPAPPVPDPAAQGALAAPPAMAVKDGRRLQPAGIP
jgi:hypothetical protein